MSEDTTIDTEAVQGFDIEHLYGATAHLTHETEHGTIKLEYRPSAVSPDTMAEMQRLIRAVGDANVAAAIEANAAYLSEILVGWNLTAGGQALPCNRETIRKLGVDVIAGLLNAIRDHIAAAGNAKPGT